MTDLEECDCECHESEGVYHVAPCCYECLGGCGKRLEFGKYCRACETVDLKQPPRRV